MTTLLIISALVVLVAVLPVMLAARIVGAARTSLGAALLAVVLQTILSAGARGLYPSVGVAVVVAIVGGSIVYALTLDTTFVRGFLIALIAPLIAIVAFMVLGSFFAASFVVF